jgi:hypothetical protein
LDNPVERNTRESDPEGQTNLSPAIQRWGKWKK